MPSVANPQKHFNSLLSIECRQRIEASVKVRNLAKRETVSEVPAVHAAVVRSAGTETGPARGAPRSGTAAGPSSLSLEGMNPETTKERCSHLASAPDEATQSKYHLPQVWADFIDTFFETGDWYVDLTFRGFPHPERAVKGFDRFIHRLNRDCFGVRYWQDKRKGVTWARATEPQKRDCDHFHAFIGNVPDYIEMMVYFEDWRREEGHCSFRVYDKTLGASFYMAKHTYAWKDGQIDLSANLKYLQDGTLVSAESIEQASIAEYRFLKPLHGVQLTP